MMHEIVDWHFVGVQRKKKLIEKNHHEWEKNVGTTNKAYCVVKCNAL
jgi:hypothetical protein